MRRSAIVLALVATVACRRHEAAAPSSTVTTAPSSVSSASPAEASDQAANERARKAALAEATEHGTVVVFGVHDAGLESAPTDVGATRPAGSSPTPNVRMGAVTVNGRLPKEVVQRIVHVGLGPIRRCYEDGLERNASLAGRVTTRFVIGTDGQVSSARDAGSDLTDHAVVTCVVRSFGKMEFPPPEAGTVTATVPLMFGASQP